MGTKKIDLRTSKQKEKDARNAKIISAYSEIISECRLLDKSSKFAIYRGVGRKFGLSPSGIRMVLLKNKVIEK